MSEKRFDKSKDNQIRENGLIMNTDEVVDLLNSQSKLISAYMYEFAKMSKENKKLREENEQLKNELRKEKSLREYSDSMYGADLIVNIRFSNGEWKADVSVIDDE